MKNVVVGVLVRNGQVLACRRRKDARYPLKWEFPGGKIEPGEHPEETLRRELREELSIEFRTAERFHQQEWTYPEGVTDPAHDGTFRVHYYMIRHVLNDPVNLVFEEIRWVTPAELLAMDILEGNREAVLLLTGNAHQGRS